MATSLEQLQKELAKAQAKEKELQEKVKAEKKRLSEIKKQNKIEAEGYLGSLVLKAFGCDWTTINPEKLVETIHREEISKTLYQESTSSEKDALSSLKKFAKEQEALSPSFDLDAKDSQTETFGDDAETEIVSEAPSPYFN